MKTMIRGACFVCASCGNGSFRASERLARRQEMNKLNTENRSSCIRKSLQNPMRLIVPISIALVLVGCGVDEQIKSSAQSLVTHNALASNALASNALASNALASNQLSSNRFTVADRDLIETEDGREVLTYTVSCALPDGVTLTGTDSQ